MLRPPPLHCVPSVSGVSVAGGEYSGRAGDYSRDLSLPLCRIPMRDDISLGGSIYPSPTSAAGVGVHFSVISGEMPDLDVNELKAGSPSRWLDSLHLRALGHAVHTLPDDTGDADRRNVLVDTTVHSVHEQVEDGAVM